MGPAFSNIARRERRDVGLFSLAQRAGANRSPGGIYSQDGLPECCAEIPFGRDSVFPAHSGGTCVHVLANKRTSRHKREVNVMSQSLTTKRQDARRVGSGIGLSSTTRSEKASPREVATSEQPALKRLLFATDFSERSLKALQFLSALVRNCGVELYIAHLITPAAYKSIPCDSISWGISDLVEDANMKMANLLRSDVLTGIPIAGTTVAQGPAETIRKFAFDHDIDLLALGIRGSGYSHGARAGSFLAEVLHNPPCPLLLL